MPDLPEEPSDGTDGEAGPEARISWPLATGLGLQLAGMVLPGAVLIPTVVFRSASQPEEVVLWAVFASLVACGATTILQAQGLGRFGGRYLIVAGASGAAIAVSIAALKAGGPALLAALVLAMAFLQLGLSVRLAPFRSVLTPTVTGTIVMLVPVTVTPVLFEQMNDVPPGASPAAGPLCAFVTLATVAGIMLKARGSIGLWAPVIGIVAGSLVAAAFGLYDTAQVADAPWIGLPTAVWPAVHFEPHFGIAFWTLLPTFLFVGLVCTIQTTSGAVAIQRVSWSKPRAVNFRAVQRAVAADSVGNLLSALAGTMPLGARPNGAAMVETTGMGSRSIGIAAGIVFLALACLPKALAVVLAVPGPVTATFITLTMATIFIVGVKMVVQDGMDPRKGVIVGAAFWIGVGFEHGVVFPDFMAILTGAMPLNGIVAGGVAAILGTLFVQLTRPRTRATEVALDSSSLPQIREFVAGFASRSGWDERMAARLDAVSEETLLTLLGREEAASAGPRRLLVTARRDDGGGATLEFLSARGDENLQDRIALLGEASAGARLEEEVSLRLLRHLASSVHHQQYYDMDVVTVRVDPTRRTTHTA